MNRQPHAVLNLNTRILKAKKIEELLDFFEPYEKYRLLEVGVGSGGIANYFGSHEKFDISVDAVDVVDSRLITGNYKFQKVDGCFLPYESGCFDVVISNHVIEHVGERMQQMEHLAEIRRVLNKNGVAYLAVPNRWMLIEPHYKLIFLSWLPRSYRSAYLRFFQGKDFYDCEPLEKGELETLLYQAGFSYENLCIRALKKTYKIEKPTSILGKILCKIPDAIYAPFVPVVPTLIYRIRLVE